MRTLLASLYLLFSLTFVPVPVRPFVRIDALADPLI
jgi:hypothetical protein